MNTGRTQFKKGHRSEFAGRKHSKASKLKMSLAHIGKKQSQETIEKRSNVIRGRKYSKERVEKVANANRGQKRSPASRKRMSLAHIGIPSKKKGKKGVPQTEAGKRKIREWQINHPNRKFKDTDIELKMEAELQRRGINYQKQVPLCSIAIVDFYLPEYRIVIQCDGDYWHNRQGAKERDERQDKVLIFNGFNVYRFWGHEINKDVIKCINQLNINK